MHLEGFTARALRQSSSSRRRGIAVAAATNHTYIIMLLN